MDNFEGFQDFLDVLQAVLLYDVYGGHVHRRACTVLEDESVCAAAFVIDDIQQLQYGKMNGVVLLKVRVDFVIDSDLALNFVFGDLFEYFDDDFLIGKDVGAEEDTRCRSLTEKAQNFVVIFEILGVEVLDWGSEIIAPYPSD